MTARYADEMFKKRSGVPDLSDRAYGTLFSP